eukprot:gene8262-8450_t
MQRSAASERGHASAERQFRIRYFSISYLVETVALLLILIGQTWAMFSGQIDSDDGACSGGNSVWSIVLVAASLALALTQGLPIYYFEQKARAAWTVTLLEQQELRQSDISAAIRAGASSSNKKHFTSPQPAEQRVAAGSHGPVVSVSREDERTQQHDSQAGNPLQLDPDQWQELAEDVLQSWPGWTVVKQLQGVALLDQTWRLPQAEVSTAAPAPAAPSTAAGRSHAEGGTDVASAVAAGQSPAIKLPSISATSLGTDNNPTAMPVAALEPELAGSTAPRPDNVLAHLPLLMLPAVAHAEVMQLFQAAGDACQDLDLGYQQLLPLLQDWATTILWKGSGAAASGQGDIGSSCSSSPEGTLAEGMEALYAALLGFFEDLDMVHCCKLLSQQRWRQRQLAAAGDGGLGHQLQLQHQVAGQVTPGDATCCGGEGAPQGCAAGEAEPSASGASWDVASHTDRGLLRHAGREKQQLQKDFAGGAARGAEAAVANVECRELGSGTATCSQAYALYRAGVLQHQDLLVAICFLLISAGVLGKLFLLLWKGNLQQVLLLMEVLKASVAALTAMPHLLLWYAAAASQQRHANQLSTIMEGQPDIVSWVVLHRGLIFNVTGLLRAVLGLVFLGLGGPWAVALASTVRHYQASVVLYFVYTRVVNPVLHAAPVHASIGWMVDAGLFEAAFPLPVLGGLSWLHACAVYAVLTAGSVLVAGALEARMQRRFLRASWADQVAVAHIPADLKLQPGRAEH